MIFNAALESIHEWPLGVYKPSGGDGYDLFFIMSPTLYLWLREREGTPRVIPLHDLDNFCDTYTLIEEYENQQSNE